MLNLFNTFAQDYALPEPDVTTYQLDYSTTAGDELSTGVLLLVYGIMFLVFGLPTLVGMWKIFQKAGRPGWAAIVPFYNIWTLLKIIGRPAWWMVLWVLSFIPLIGLVPALVATIVNSNDLAKSFGKDVGWTVLLILVPFVAYPILGFSKDIKYVGPAAAEGGASGHGGTTPPAPAATPPAPAA
jgi:hypothetical protein